MHTNRYRCTGLQCGTGRCVATPGCHVNRFFVKNAAHKFAETVRFSGCDWGRQSIKDTVQEHRSSPALARAVLDVFDQLNQSIDRRFVHGTPHPAGVIVCRAISRQQDILRKVLISLLRLLISSAMRLPFEVSVIKRYGSQGTRFFPASIFHVPPTIVCSPQLTGNILDAGHVSLMRHIENRPRIIFESVRSFCLFLTGFPLKDKATRPFTLKKQEEIKTFFVHNNLYVDMIHSLDYQTLALKLEILHRVGRQRPAGRSRMQPIRKQ